MTATTTAPIEALGEAISTSALRALVFAKADWFRAASRADREAVLRVMHIEAVEAILEVIEAGRQNPGMEAALTASAVARIVAAGAKAIAEGPRVFS
jgi:hypothetical protein